MNIKVKSIIFAVFLATIPVLITMNIYITKFSERSIELIKENVIIAAKDQSTHLEDFFDQRLINLNVISNMPITHDFLDDFNNNILDKSEEMKFRRKIIFDILNLRQQEQAYLVKTSLISKDNTIIASSDGNSVGNKAVFDKNDIIKFNNKEIVITDIIENEKFNNGEKSAIIAIPIFFEDEYQGIIESVINMQYFEKVVNEVHFFNTGEIIVMDSRGTVAATISDYLNENIYNIDKPNTLEEEWRNIDFKNNSSGLIEYSIDEIEKIGYFYKIPNSNWVVLSVVEWSEFKDPLNESINIMFFMSIIISAVVSITYILIINFFSKPIYGLLNSIREIKKGNYKSRFIYNIKDEFGEISQAFNELMDEILKNKMQLKLSEESYRVIMEQTDDIIFQWDINSDIISYSDNWNHKFNYKLNSQGKDLRTLNIIYEEDREKFNSIIAEIKNTNEYRECEVRLRKNYNGEYIWCKVRINLILDDNNKPIKAIGLITDIDNEKRENEKLIFKAERDSLTEIYNKITAQNMIEEYINKSKKDDRHALFIIDIDDFKSINDNLGHLTGDSVLKDISIKITEIFNENSIIGRIGGDEFIVFLKSIQSDEFVCEKANELVSGFRENYTGEDGVYKVSGSIGIAMYPKGGLNFEQLFLSADKALYFAKKQGKDTYYISNV
ncbi:MULTISPECIES: diguanylate cyclase [Clostridium]|uniref:Signaling protein n=1 Tax=Clostridium botulinum (strain Eklund 17B / Type B) TaxID=935198 RepID=B2TQC3_CLOBB|nr:MULTISPECIES: diguanylate cyclase [Clostridium]ACD24858.1 putative signaling protein [Clostridium botulinum B str. Eklund 17B (NRP)]MBN1056514.1 diguanylate cyclase [Clostridium botulinum]MBY6975560.1 diguanylate cyclase [Clostridium botulinum]MBY7001109.1 diguanylate cyclase [Clostridium botulinum]MCR1273876.1 diguanylate cyclase [Clostridium botulinum]